MPSPVTKPHYVFYVIACLQSKKFYKGRGIDSALTKVIGKKIDKDKSSKIIDSLIRDGVLFMDSNNNGALCIANDREAADGTQDMYCFECFLPGTLVKCHDCTRAFHATCTRRHPERPNYVIPKSNHIAEFDDDEEDLQERFISRITSRNRIKRCCVRLQRTEVTSVSNTNVIESVNDNLKCDEKPEVVCLGEVRPPTRQRNITENSSIKYESDSDGSSSTNQMNIERNLCTFCRLLKAGKNLQPPNLNATEMCHLLKYTFKRNRAWIKHDILKHFDNMKLTNESIAFIKQVLFPNRRMMTLDTMEEKIHYNQYNMLNELLADITEFQYALGVLFGSNHTDFDCSKYLFRDIQYDIKEIRRCPDCYRHSSDRITPYWFAFPCVQRHELVLAKCKGHAYWPAKVVRVLRKADKYDVRFFGGNHERAVVDKNYIRPIEAADVLKSKSSQFKKAMNEMMCYQALKACSLEKFSFYSANKFEIDQIIKTVMYAIDVNLGAGAPIRKRRKTIAEAIDISRVSNIFNEDNSSSNLEGSYSEARTPTPNRRREPLKPSTAPPNPRCHAEEFQIAGSPTIFATNVGTPSSTSHLITTANNLENHAMICLQCEQLKRKIEIQEHELNIAKRKSYCFICLKPAEFICCINASYCSKQCQSQHWVNGHNSSCSHRTTNCDKKNQKKKVV